MANSTASQMTKAAIVDHIAGETSVSKKDVDAILSSMVRLAYKEAKKGFTIPRLGKLYCSKRKARMGRNVRTGETIKIPAGTVVRFRVSKFAKDAVVHGKMPAVKKAAPKKAAAKKPAAKKR